MIRGLDGTGSRNGTAPIGSGDTMDALRDGTRQMLAERKEMMREIVRGLSPEALNWIPLDGRARQEMNSIAQLLSHALDAERFLVAIVAGVRLDRDRESHFRARVDGAGDLLGLIDSADREVSGHAGQLTADLLAAQVQIVEPTWPVPDVTHSGAYWLLHAIEHTSEHIGQALLTRQWYEER